MQIGTGHRQAAVLDQQLKELKCLLGEMDFVGVPQQASSIGVECESVEAKAHACPELHYIALTSTAIAHQL
jgi:hypothetical protein